MSAHTVPLGGVGFGSGLCLDIWGTRLVVPCAYRDCREWRVGAGSDSAARLLIMRVLKMFENGGDILRAQNLTTAANMTVASLLSSRDS